LVTLVRDRAKNLQVYLFSGIFSGQNISLLCLLTFQIVPLVIVSYTETCGDVWHVTPALQK